VTLVTAGIVIGLVKGGRAWWQHWILRFLLAGNHLIPWRYVEFLEEAYRYNLLRKIGREGYSFYHGLFQDYFASLTTDGDQKTTSK
jgi:hypothetical protein